MNTSNGSSGSSKEKGSDDPPAAALARLAVSPAKPDWDESSPARLRLAGAAAAAVVGAAAAVGCRHGGGYPDECNDDRC